jgi:hypothetical protein
VREGNVEEDLFEQLIGFLVSGSDDRAGRVR